MDLMNRIMTNKVFKVLMALVLALAMSIPSTLVSSGTASAAEKKSVVAPVAVDASAVTATFTVADTFQTYTSIKDGTSPKELPVTVGITVSQADLEGLTVEIPYGFIPDNSQENWKNFTMTDPIFNLDTSKNPTLSASSNVESIDTSNTNKLVLKLKKTTVGMESLQFTFTFNESYRNKIPKNQVIWKDAGAVVKDSTAATVSETAKTDVKAKKFDNDQNDWATCTRQYPTGESIKYTALCFQAFYTCYDLDYSEFDYSKDAYIFVDIPNTVTNSSEITSYFDSGTKTSATDSSIPSGYKRYYKSITDANKKTIFNNLWSGVAGQYYATQAATIRVPSTAATGTSFHLQSGIVATRKNGTSETIKSPEMNYTKVATKAWDLRLGNASHYNYSYSHDTQMIVHKVGERTTGDPTSHNYIVVGGINAYSGSSTVNEGSSPATGIEYYLRQPETGSERANFSEIYVFSQGILDAAKSHLKVSLEICNAKTGETKTQSYNEDSQGSLKIGGSGVQNLPTLAENEYIKTVTVTPTGSGSQDGCLLTENAVMIQYKLDTWSNDQWPDGTAMDLTKSTTIDMSWDLKYNDESGASQKLQGNTYSILYVPQDSVNVNANFVCDDATRLNPGDTANYRISGTVDKDSLNDWENPEFRVAIPKIFDALTDGATYTFKNEKSATETADAFVVNKVSEDDAYVYYKFSVASGKTVTCLRNQNNTSFSIPVDLTVKSSAPAGTYSVPYVVLANSDSTKNFNQVTGTDVSSTTTIADKREMNNLTSDMATNFGLASSQNYSAVTSGHTAATVVGSVALSSSTAGRADSTKEWESGTDTYEVKRGGTAQMKATLNNAGSTTFKNIKIYDILPSTADGRGSTGSVAFSGVEDLPTGATVYYTTKAVSELPTYSASNLATWTSETLESYGFTTTKPTDGQATAIYIDYGTNELAGNSSLNTVLNFTAPNEGNQNAYNQFQYSATESASGAALTAVSNQVLFTSNFGEVTYDANLPATLPSGVTSATDIPAEQSTFLDATTMAGSVTIPTTTPTLQGYTFTNWTDADGNTYSPGDTISWDSSSASYVVDLKANWTGVDVNVVYNSNYGETPATQTKTYKFGDQIDLTQVTGVTQPGYSLKGWATTQGATSADFVDKTTVDFLTEKTVYALWEDASYSVTHTLTNVTADGATGANAATHGTNYTTNLTSESGYDMPTSVSVTAGGVALGSGDFTYTRKSNSSGSVEVLGSAITGDIDITVVAVQSTASSGKTDSTGAATIRDPKSNEDKTIKVEIDGVAKENIPVEFDASGNLKVTVPEADKNKPIKVTVTDSAGGVKDVPVNVVDDNTGAAVGSGSTDASGVLEIPGTSGTTGTSGEATIKDPTDNSSKTIKVEIDGATKSDVPVEFDASGNLKVTVPEADKNKPIKVTVTDSTGGVKDVPVSVVDDNTGAEVGSGNTDDSGVLEIPGSSGKTGTNGQATIKDPTDNSSKTIKVEIDGATKSDVPVEFDASGNLKVTVPEADKNKPIKVTVTDGSGGVKDVPVSVVDDKGNAAGSGKTDNSGVLEIPGTSGTTDNTGKVDLKDPTSNKETNVEVVIGGETKKDIPVEIDETGKLIVKVPEADRDKEIKITVKDDTGSTVNNKPVEVIDESGNKVSSGATDSSGVYTKPSQSLISGVEGEVKVDGKTVKDGDRIDLADGAKITITWYPVKSGNNVKFLDTVGIEGTSYSAYDNIKKDNWQEANTTYDEKMGESGSMMTTIDKVTSAMQTVEVTVKAGAPITLNWVETAPIYRMYNSITSEHLFSSSKTEYDSWVQKCLNNEDYWIGEGIDWFSSTAETDKALYRLYNPQLGAMGRSSHYYTSDEAEKDDLIANWDWQDDGIQVEFKDGGREYIYTAYSEDLGSAHHYTSSFTEWRGLDSGWDKEDAKNGLASDGKSATGFFDAWIAGKAS